jgi:hypothetical protein
MKTNKSPKSLFATIALLMGTIIGHCGIVVPGDPKGSLPAELLQSRSFCRGMERSLQLIEDRYPSLSFEVLTAKASWKSSPFSSGCDAIEAEIVSKAGKDGRSLLNKLDAEIWAEISKHARVQSIGDAREFLTIVDRRAKGEIEIPMVRGNLLWNHKPFQENPEKEVERGYVQKITHTCRAGRSVISFQVPMSWKSEESSKVELMSFRNCYGHGNVWMTVIVSKTVDELGKPINAARKFSEYTEESLRRDYNLLGIELTSFMKTKVNEMPCLIFTRKQLHEQLGQRATRSAEVIRVFHGDHMVSFQINTLGPEGETTAADRISKNKPLFRLIGKTIKIED